MLEKHLRVPKTVLFILLISLLMAVNELKYLDWDSAFFGKKIYRFDLGDVKDFGKYQRLASRSGADLVYLFSPEQIPRPSDENFFIADKKIIFQKQVEHTTNLMPKKNINETRQNSSDLQNLALLSGSFSRFKLDERLSPKYKELYLLWLNRSLSGELASKVFVYRSGNKDAGFITVKREDRTGIIGLIATDPAFQGQNIGSSLIAQVEHWSMANEIDTMEVATQLDNVIACGFYIKNGFVTKTIDHIYHHYLS
jgi:dTDP-4-amino-4,6-dideoxy-D-galactose acyltransferase